MRTNHWAEYARGRGGSGMVEHEITVDEYELELILAGLALLRDDPGANSWDVDVLSHRLGDK